MIGTTLEKWCHNRGAAATKLHCFRPSKIAAEAFTAPQSCGHAAGAGGSRATKAQRNERRRLWQRCTMRLQVDLFLLQDHNFYPWDVTFAWRDNPHSSVWFKNNYPLKRKKYMFPFKSEPLGTLSHDCTKWFTVLLSEQIENTDTVCTILAYLTFAGPRCTLCKASLSIRQL